MQRVNGLLFDLSNRTSPAAWQTVGLFLVDSFNNLTDYGFHIFLGRTLTPGDFAVVQTVNAVLLIVIATSGVMQPVVARQIAEAEAAALAAGTAPSHSRVIFQQYLRRTALAGLLLVAVAWLLRQPLAELLNVPGPAVGVSAIMVLFALLRPVVDGLMQGRQRFIAFGALRSTYAVGRFLAGVTLVSLGAGALGAIAAIPIAATLALALGLGLAGRAIWQPGPELPAGLLRRGLRLSIGAFVAYAAYMSLHQMDLIWVNRSFAAETAGSYATAVLLRRALALVPGAVVVIMYPRVVAEVARGQSPDRLLWKTATVVLGSTLLLTGVYFVFGSAIVRLTFGAGYMSAGPLLGWMGVAMLGFGLAGIWLNVYLATRPLPYVLLLAGTAVVHSLLLAQHHATLQQTTAIFLLSGWTLAAGGLAIYLGWLRPQLVATADR